MGGGGGGCFGVVFLWGWGEVGGRGVRVGGGEGTNDIIMLIIH